ncbi:MAG: helix-turn-helix transcriptional regulator [bacterium]
MSNNSSNYPTFDQLPSLVDQLFRKVSRIEILLESKNSHQEEDEKPMGVNELHSFTGLAIPTIYAKCSKNEMPYHKQGKKLWFFKDEIIEWMKSGKPKNSINSGREALSGLRIRNKGKS